MQQFLAALPLLACPVGMGAMMWWMSRNGHNQTSGAETPDQAAEVTRLRTELDQLRAAHQARTPAAEHNARGNA